MRLTHTLKRQLLDLLLITGVATVSLFIYCESCRDFPAYFFRSWMMSTVLWLILWKGNEGISHFLGKDQSWIKAPIKTLVTVALSSIVFTGAAMALVLLFFGWVYNFDVSSTIENNVKMGILVGLFIGTFMHGRSFLLSWKQAAVNAERLKNENLVSKYESLKNQINPHFLFNNLNTLTGLVYQDADKAAKFIKQLSEVYRYVLDTREQEVVDLFKELKFLDSYIFLQQIRYGDNIKFNIEIHDPGNCKIAPLSLQMLVENAIKHNIISDEDPLEITIKFDGNEYIQVENTLKRKNILPQTSTGMGLKNIKERYEYLTDRLVQISQTDSQFMVKLPVINYI